MHRSLQRGGALANTGVLVAALAFAPLARAETLYLAQAIGEPPVSAPELRTRPPDAIPELPGLGTDTPPPATVSSTDGGSTWKWVAGIALTVALIALAKGGDSGGGTSGGGNSGGGGGGGGGDDDDDDDRRGGGAFPTLPVLPGAR